MIATVINELGPHVLMQVFQRMDNMNLVLSVFSYVSKTWLQASLLYFDSICKPLYDQDGVVDFSSIVNIHGATINSILRHTRHNISSKKLKITATFELTAKRLYTIAKKNPQLTHLYLYGCRHLSFSGILETCKILPNLKYIDVRECPLISEHPDASSLFKIVPHIEHSRRITNSNYDVDALVLKPEKGREDLFQQQCNILGIYDISEVTFHRVKQQYKLLSKTVHPDQFLRYSDKQTAHNNFIKIHSAYEYLGSLIQK